MKVKTCVQLSNFLDETMPDLQSLLNSHSTNPENNLLYNFIYKFESYDKIKTMFEKRFIASYIKLTEKLNCKSVQVKAMKIYETVRNRNLKYLLSKSNGILQIQYTFLIPISFEVD